VIFGFLAAWRSDQELSLLLVEVADASLPEPAPPPTLDADPFYSQVMEVNPPQLPVQATLPPCTQVGDV
jgi:hypothetical protein